MRYTNEITVSTKALKAAKESLGNLIDETGEIVAGFKALQEVAGITGLPLDGQIMNECEQMFITINRLLYEQQSKLKHLQMMKIATEKASQAASRFHTLRNARPAPEATLFNQTA